MSNSPGESTPSNRSEANSPAVPLPIETEPATNIPMAIPLATPLPGTPEKAIPVAMPVAVPTDAVIPVALPVAWNELHGLNTPLPLAVPVQETVPSALPVAQPVVDSASGSEPAAQVVAEPVAAVPTTLTCPVCQSIVPCEQPYCQDCGYHFSEADREVASGLRAKPASLEPTPTRRVLDRYELGELHSERQGVQRYHAVDCGESPPRAVWVLRAARPIVESEPTPPVTEAPQQAHDEVLPMFDQPVAESASTTFVADVPTWPSIAWERRLLQTLEHPSLPAVLADGCDETHEYLVLEVPTGQTLWDAWEEVDAPAERKWGLLLDLVELLQRLHQCQVIFQSLRPEQFVVAQGRIRLRDLSDLLPLPIPSELHVPAGLYTAPELMTQAGRQVADARADLYGFGVLLYSLFLGRELNEQTDFDEAGTARLFSRFPDLHPGLGRLFLKTLRRQVEARFPTDEAALEDATGFTELLRTLEVLRRTYDQVRLEVASWTSAGIVRTNNEDAYAVLHASETRQDDVGEAVLVILCDGMGGYEAGEVAAALAIQSLRQQLIQLKPFDVVAGASPFVTDPLTQMGKLGGHTGHRPSIESIQQAICKALKEANRQVFLAARAPGTRRRGMGCTAEVVYIDGWNVVVGHVGDSRTYHLHEGKLVQLTRDQTLVNRLVELGSLTPQEAETHPRRNELQQAIGGQPDVEPGLYHGKMSAGDWVVVCSDGLTSHVTVNDLQHMLQSEATSAQAAARRLVNLALIEGATDNVTVVVVRAC
jgi:serine/threonine protein phosphatase PrpC/serine/threonine protein kinase